MLGPDRSLVAAALAAALLAALPAGAETRTSRTVFDDADEPAWFPRAAAPLADWVDAALLDHPSPRIAALARRVREGRASKPELRELRALHPLAYPYGRPAPRAWRERSLASARADRARLASAGLAGAAWASIGPGNVGGRTAALALDPSNPNRLYAGAADGGVWRLDWDPSGPSWTWTPLFDEQPTLSIGALAVDPVDSRRIHVGTGEQNWSLDEYDGVGLVRSPDGGRTWLAPVPIGGAGRIGALAVDPVAPEIVFAATSRGLYRSLDRGQTWTPVLEGGAADAVVLDPSRPGVVYAAIEGDANGGGNPWGVYRSTAGGAPGSFARLAGAAGCTLPARPDGTRSALAVAPSAPDRLYLAFDTCDPGSCPTPNGAVWRSDDGGATWCPVATPGTFCGYQCWYDIVLAVDPVDPDHVLAGGVGFFRSTDAGQTWTQVNGMHVDHHAIVFAPPPDRAAWVGNDGGVYRLDLNGPSPTLRNLEQGYVTAQYYGFGHDPIDPARLYGGSQDNGTHRFTRPATTVNGVALVGCGDGAAVRVNPGLNRRLFHTVCPARGDLEFLVSDDFGATSARQTTGIQVAEGSDWVPPVETLGAATVFTATSSRVYRSDNAGDSDPLQIRFAALDRTQATITQDLTPSGGSITTVSASPAAPSLVWAGTSRGQVWVTTNGLDWSEVWRSTGGRNRHIGEVVAHPTDPLVAWVVLGGYGSADQGGHVFETTNQGASWADLSGNLPDDLPVNAILPHPFDPDRFWIGTWLGVFETRDHGATWLQEPTVPAAVVVDLAYDATTRSVYAATHGRGVWTLDDTAVPAPPRPIPDGVVDRGQPVWAARLAGSSDIVVSWEGSSCPGNVDTHLYWAPLSDKAGFGYDAAACSLGTRGVARVSPPAGDRYFLLAGVGGDGDESGHRRADGGGWEPAWGRGLCPGVAGQDLSQSCP